MSAASDASGRDLAWLGRLSLPVVVAPMFLASGTALVKAACAAGLVGTFPALNARTTDDLDDWLGDIEAAQGAGVGAAYGAIYGVNLVVHRTNPRLEADLAVLERHRVPLVITALGAVSSIVDRVHAWGGKVFHDSTNVHHAGKAGAAGVDGIIIVAAGAGGHAGTINPFALLGEVRAVYDGLLILAGGLSTGADVLAALAAGADLAYMGTRFIATDEATADPAYKQMIVNCGSADIIHTRAVSGVPANFLRPSLIAAGYDVTRLKSSAEINYGEKLKPPGDEVKAWKTVWSAGHGAGCVASVEPVEQLAGTLHREFSAAQARLRALRW